MIRSLFALLFLVTALAACAGRPVSPDDHCASGSLLLDAHFEGGMLGRCVVSTEGVFNLTIFPEDKPPINESPWYAFRVSGDKGDQAVIQISFRDGYARYWPKTSYDKTNWIPVPADQVTLSESGTQMEIRLALDQARLWVAAQELLTSRYYDRWLNELAAHPEITTSLVGQSVQGRPIYLADTGGSNDVIILLGRQHPPEVTGPIAMRPFVTTLLSDTKQARHFRERYRLIILPLLNPDGVAAGYWRHNVNGVDLNRDWGPFTQPETQAVRNWLDDSAQQGIRLHLMLDFHSTMRNVFYTQRDVDPTTPADFTGRWLTGSSKRLPDYDFKREANETSSQPNSKNYFYTRYGIPAITYETGDETSREAAEKAAVVFAQEMMRIMLEYPAAKP
jgi:predicted deacylase